MKSKGVLSTTVVFILTLSILSANNAIKKNCDINVANSKSSKLQKTFNQEVANSVGVMYLKNIIKKNKDIKSVTVREIYTKNVSEDWKGGVFEVTINGEYGKENKKVVKLFYNDGGLVVLDIFTVDGRSMIQQLSVPLLSEEVAYNKDFLILSRDIKKKSPKGKDMVIFSDPQCPYCIQRIPKLLDFARENNMNVYFYDIPLPIPDHANSKEIAICINTVIKKNKGNAVEIIKNSYKHHFGKRKKSLEAVIIEFNKISGVSPITKKDIDDNDAKKHLEDSINISDILHISGTPTVYVDGRKL